MLPEKDIAQARDLIGGIARLNLPKKVRILNVCGGHERVVAHAALRDALKDQVDIIAGPGCPVCICPEEDIFYAIHLALNENAVIASFGDMLRVPCNQDCQGARSLIEARALGAKIEAISSPLDIFDIAEKHPDHKVVFFAVGFETTTAPIAASLSSRELPENLFILTSTKKTWPAVKLLLSDDDHHIDGLVIPGHVATIMGTKEWSFVSDDHHLPAVVSGFDPLKLLQAIFYICKQISEKRSELQNGYGEVVLEEGNKKAQALIDKTFETVDSDWRGVGEIKDSGYALASSLADREARHNFTPLQRSHRSAGKMPRGCQCAAVVMGKKDPLGCGLYGKHCTPSKPIGPCMVSDEGTCHIWWQGGIRHGDKT